MICYVLAMGKQNLGPHVVVGYGIKIFWPGLFITSPDHLEYYGRYSWFFILLFMWNHLWCHHFPHLYNTKTWISLKRKKILQKGKRHSSLLWKAFKISSNYFLLHRHFKVPEHSFQVLMPKSPLLLNYLCFGASFLQESRLTTEAFIFAFWLGCVLLPWQQGIKSKA